MSNKRDELEAIASREVMRSGLNKLSFRKLADLAGVKSSSVHHYFPEKSDLARAVLDNYTLAFSNELAEIHSRHADPRKRLMAFVDIFERVADDEVFCLCGMLAAEISLLDDETRVGLRGFFDTAERWLEGVLKTDTVELAINMSPAALSRLILTGLEGALLIELVDRRQRHIKTQREFIRKLLI